MERKYERLGSRYVKVFTWIVFLIILVGSIVFVRKPPTDRLNFLVIADPMIVASWEPKENQFHIIEIPANVHINALYNYGRYSLDALWKLGKIDKKEGLLEDSIEEFLALPLDGFIDPKSKEIPVVVDSVEYIQNRFSLRALVQLRTFWSFARGFKTARPDQITKITISAKEEELPDGSRAKIADEREVDRILSDTFEDAQIRSEAMRVSVFNTTQFPMLGERVSRFLTRAGILVIAVGNDPNQISKCEVLGSSTALDTKTAQFTLQTFGCTKKISELDVPADIVLKIGSEWGRRFTQSEPDL